MYLVCSVSYKKVISYTSILVLVSKTVYLNMLIELKRGNSALFIKTKQKGFLEQKEMVKNNDKTYKY